MVLIRRAQSPPSIDQRIFRFILHRAKNLVLEPHNVNLVRHRMEALARLQPVTHEVAIRPVSTASVSGEWIIPRGSVPDRVILYIHGGAFMTCSPTTHRPMVARLAVVSHSPALSVKYRLAPEHPFPAALEDCLSVYRWLLGRGIPPRSIVVGGDSAGGNLALTLMLALRSAGDPLPAAAVLLSPVTDMTASGGSRVSKAHIDPIFSNLAHNDLLIEPYWRNHDPHDPLISPIYADLHGLPPLLFHVGEDEILLDDSTRMVERALAAGVDAKVVIWPHMWHVFQAFSMFVAEGQESLGQIGEFIRTMQAREK